MITYSEIQFFPIRAAFNLTWREQPAGKIWSYIAPKGILLASGGEPDETLPDRRARYADFPPFRAIAYPALPAKYDLSPQ